MMMALPALMWPGLFRQPARLPRVRAFYPLEKHSKERAMFNCGSPDKSKPNLLSTKRVSHPSVEPWPITMVSGLLSFVPGSTFTAPLPFFKPRRLVFPSSATSTEPVIRLVVRALSRDVVLMLYCGKMAVAHLLQLNRFGTLPGRPAGTWNLSCQQWPLLSLSWVSDWRGLQ